MMNKYKQWIAIALIALISSSLHAASGLFFNVSSTNNVLSISTTVPNHVYTSAGIWLNNSSYSLTYAGQECRPLNNGYCLFTASTTPTPITISGPDGNVNFVLCLNSLGILSCQQYSAQIQNNLNPTLYVGAPNGNLDISTDNGTTWTPTATQPDGTIVTSVFVTSNSIIYAGTATTVEISANNGASWTPTTEPVLGGGVLSVFLSGGNLYTSSSDLVYVSNNNGISWSTTNVSPDSSAIFSVFVLSNGTIYTGTDNGNVMVSTDGGNTWTPTTQPDNSRVGAVVVTQNGTLYAGTSNGNVEISSNAGASWTPTSLPDGCSINGMSVLSNGTIYVGTGCGSVLYSTNQGVSWTATTTQPPGGILGFFAP